jgi:hypothetical protein
MLSVVLLGIALGGLLAPLLARAGFAWAAAASAIAVVAGDVVAGPLHIPGPPELLRYALPLMLPAATLSGALFTLLGAGLRGAAENPQAAIGRLTTANTLGAALGAALASLVLLPLLGMEKSLFVLAAGYALLPLLAVGAGGARRLAWPAALALAALALFPFGRIQSHLAEAALPYQLRDDARVVRVTEGPTTTLQVLRRDRFGEPAGWRLLTDSYSMTAINRYALRYMQLFAWLPLSFHPQPRRALLISYGAGNTAQALLSDPQLEHLSVVDLSPEMLAASPLLHGERDPLRDPRVRVVREDGRHFLRTRSERFDIITAEPPPPGIAGVVNLYTREYFQTLAARLAPGGLATYWLPVAQFRVQGAKAVVAAFCDAFPDCTLWSGTKRDWILMGSRDYASRLDARELGRLWRVPLAAQRLAANGLEHPPQLGASFLADAAQLRQWLASTAPLVDDRPKRLEPAQSFDVEPPDYEQWVHPEGARLRFAASAWIAAHWPADFLAWTPQYFAIQPTLTGQVAADPVSTLPHVDALLRHTDLRVPILWLLDTDMTEQAILERRLAEGAEAMRPEYAFPLGAKALADRDYARAARLLAQAAERNPRAGAAAAYALCRAGASRKAAVINGARQLSPALRCWKE